MGPEDPQIASLIAALDHPDKPTLRAAVDKLILLASDDPGLRPILDRRLAEPGHRNYWPAAYVLGHLPRPSASALEILLEALDHSQPDIRWAVLLLLVRMAKANSEIDVIGRLIRLSAGGSDNQRRMALYTIRDLALADAASLAALLAALRDPEPTVRVAAAISLKPRVDLDEAAKNLLLEIYSTDAELKVRHAVGITLASVGASQPEFVTALEKNRESADEQIKKAANAALDLLEKRRSASSGSASGR